MNILQLAIELQLLTQLKTSMKGLRYCAVCYTQETPMWRKMDRYKDKLDVQSCNACYMYWKRHNKVRKFWLCRGSKHYMNNKRTRGK